ncbi:AraC family transcriptional regulator [Pseudomonas sp. M30-35]|uniref:AraC family transcriptional regulator n=1 Tax=Pseudomonas sp. M30-35 TaxID=1981174 RepID=UPI000B3D3ACD|nr:AraC family transcriptional regulator [Pseudomonas sp. M30-35]ARU88139.1 AraC family transcriptional regulator [Pseudomonas sp. M30-35]
MTDFARASTLSGYHAFALSKGLNPTELLAQAKLPSDILNSQETMISYRKFVNLLNISSLKSNDPLFGLHYGLHQGISVFGPLIYLIRNARNVGEALRDLGNYFHLHMGAAEVRIEVQGRHVLLCYQTEEQNLPGLPQAAELAISVGAQLMRTLLGNRWQPQGVLLQHAPLASPNSYRRAWDVTPQFNSPYHAWLFDAKLLEIPLSSADEELHKLLQKHLDNLDELQLGELPGYVQQLLRNFLPNGRVTIEQIADYMMLSTRTLQRYLAEEGTSFQNLLDQTRESLATRYLRDSSTSLTQLAELLGYSELSAFSRAFQRWTGISPRQWKKQNTDPSLNKRLRVRPQRQ